MHLVLATSAAACGGAVANELTMAGEDEPDPTKETSPSNPGEEKVRRDGGSDATADAKQDAKQDAQPDVVQSCVTGQMPAGPALCCTDPEPSNCMGGWGGGDGPNCMLDCRKVCAIAAPQFPTSATEGCGYDQGQSNVYYHCGWCGVGRIPDGVASASRGATVGERLAMQAYYEAASVVAFARLAGVLEREGAPATLVKRVRRAADDERRHARLFARLARKRGACVPPLAVPQEASSLFELAIENAREGCVRETYGALVALHQSSHARDAELRAAFGAIADDEIAHAALSWDLARFFDARLSAADRVLVESARNDAMRVLRDAATADHDATDARLGMPSPAKGRALFDDLFARVA
jgi:hypothetical protein